MLAPPGPLPSRPVLGKDLHASRVPSLRRTRSADPDVQFSVPAEQITLELVEICDEFFRQASPIVHTGLDQFLTENGHPGGLGWFLDALSLTTPSNSPRRNEQAG